MIRQATEAKLEPQWKEGPRLRVYSKRAIARELAQRFGLLANLKLGRYLTGKELLS